MPLNTVYFCAKEAHNGYYKFYVCVFQKCSLHGLQVHFQQVVPSGGSHHCMAIRLGARDRAVTPPGLQVSLVSTWFVSAAFQGCISIS